MSSLTNNGLATVGAVTLFSTGHWIGAFVLVALVALSVGSEMVE